jgi:gamma-glutamylcyclotransferase (GGCT)/AIG2-like uncharacterized protein YtfP
VSTKTYLFSYGSLQKTAIQYELYGRELNGVADGLSGYILAEEKIALIFPIIKKTGLKNVPLKGIVFEITPKELTKTDAYEGYEYQRIWVTLTSGKNAWCYVKPE